MNCGCNDLQSGNDEGSRTQPADKSTPDRFNTFHARRINPTVCPGVTAAVRVSARYIGYTAMAIISREMEGPSFAFLRI